VAVCMMGSEFGGEIRAEKSAFVMYNTVGDIGGISRGMGACTVQHARPLLPRAMWDFICLNKMLKDLGHTHRPLSRIIPIASLLL
jgi:hypothetical protein